VQTPTTTSCKVITSAGESIIYDESLIASPTDELFSSDYHTKNALQQNESADDIRRAGIGRAPVRYFRHPGHEHDRQHDMALVYKHYYRGGMVARFLKDQYITSGYAETRAFREYYMLKQLEAWQLPVPVAVAARAVHVLPLLPVYRCDLITREIADVSTLADVLQAARLDDIGWQRVGACIRRFHDKGVYHADLNARNILLGNDAAGDGEADKVYLIDFDNGHIRCEPEDEGQNEIGGWKAANLARLRRSLKKFCRRSPGFHFSDDDWQQLLYGYNAL